MLTLIDSTKEKKRIQQKLAADLRTHLGSLGERLITFRPGQALMQLYCRGNSKLYFASEYQEDREVFWNAFGYYDESRRAQEIVVEIKISKGEKKTAAFFAKDVFGRVFLMHTGRVGGGRPGIGQAAFFAWHKPELVYVRRSSGSPQAAI